ncbi:hypothetical protein DDZ13_01405 [Coraliomargarita sinensis]|uniref:Glycosyltransferase RgtA/B/C/D-like domain-containing protein n=1 Tax=Coraliomargarita sinensis TaxID=2174842 RepID=A0A317ZMZ0_9BACT|nr:glycosyltransferase family 39 protein [Coraliomargarita sinensis]PXA05557.1 hypothetical protein DDZ13_01405 [Coraliomargarita sinensis]
MKKTSSKPHASKWFKASLVAYLAVVLIAVLTVSDYGMTWDETFRFQGGDTNLEYYSELFKGEASDAPSSNYPALFDLPLALFHEVFPDWGTRSQKGHVWSLCFGLLGLLSVWRLTARIGGERAGFWALLFLACLPRYYGHMFFNPKDIPFAATYAFGCWALVSVLGKISTVTVRQVVWVGLAAGLALSCRIAGLLILAYFALFVGIYLLFKYSKGREAISSLPRDLLRWALLGGLSGAIAFTILFVFWPKLHINPFLALESSVQDAQSFGWGGLVLMDGHFWKAQDLPIYYVPYWLFRTLPEPLLLLIGLGSVAGFLKFYAMIRRRRLPEPEIWLPRFFIVFAGVFPVAYMVFRDPVLYDGMRHFLFVLPPMASIGALSLEWLLRQTASTSVRWLPQAIQAAAFLSLGLVAYEMLRLHPYQYVYFNQTSGGLPGAYMRDETDYWGLSHKEAGEWLNEYVENVDAVGGKTYKVHQRYTRWMLKEALNPERFEMWEPREGADFFVSVTRFNLHTSYPEAEILHVVQRHGVPLCFVFKMPDSNKE